MMLTKTICMVLLVFCLTIPSFSELGTPDNTLFLAHYNTSLTADYAASVNGTLSPISTGHREISSSQFKFGGFSLSTATASGGFMEYDRVGNWHLAQGTLDMWIFKTNWVSSAYEGLFGLGTSGTGAHRFTAWKRNDNSLELYLSVNTGAELNHRYNATYTQVTGIGMMVDGAWNHVAFTWDTASFLHRGHVFVNGFLVGTTISNGIVTTLDRDFGPESAFNPTMTIGHTNSTTGGQGGGPWPGYIDEVRISDIDRYAGVNFTPPTGEYPLPSTGIGDWSLYSIKLPD